MPDIFLVLLDHLAVNVDDSSVTKVSWSSERIGGSVLATWESDLIVVSDVTLCSSTELLVAYFFHRLDKFLAVTSLSLEFGLLLHHVKVLNGVLVELEGLDEDR